MSPEQAAEAILRDAKFAWTLGPDFAPVIDLAGGRYLIAKGDGNPEHAYEIAEQIRQAIKRSIAQVLAGARAEHGAPPDPRPSRPRSPHVELAKPDGV